MLGQRVHIGARCHHCDVPLSFPVYPDAPGPEADGAMVWFEKHAEKEGRALDSL